LIEVIVAERITTLHFVPSMLRAWLETPGVERCVAVRQIVCSGEELPRDLVVLAHEKLPAVALHNLYGPTEAAVDVSWHACRRGETGPVPIGGPIANVELHVLDEQLRPVPVGVPGEVYLGGVGLGLSLVRSIALRHEGQVVCEGRPGGGASFVIRILTAQTPSDHGDLVAFDALRKVLSQRLRPTNKDKAAV
jgi:non-ribosomal peptide synthetase component F